MANTLEDVKLTNTTTSYRVKLDYVDLTESLDDSYIRNRTQHEEQKQVDESGNQPSPTLSNPTTE